jgi:hypothetical protein
MTSLRKRLIDVEITLNPVTDNTTGAVTRPTFSRSGKDTLLLQGYRCQAVIRKEGYISQNPLSLRIYGLSLDLMNEISTLGRLPLAGRNNTITVSAGDEIDGVAVVYKGTIAKAWANFQAMPDVFFQIESYTGLYAALAPTDATSFVGAVDVGTVISGIANRMGRSFRNHGVQTKLTDPYFHGTLLQQLQSCAQAADIEYEDTGDSIVIWPKNGIVPGVKPLVSPQTGMIGYPSFTHSGIAVSTLYNPNIGRGQLIEVESDLTPACGTWRVYTLTHVLESDIPNGEWTTYLEAAEPPYAAVR